MPHQSYISACDSGTSPTSIPTLRQEYKYLVLYLSNQSICFPLPHPRKNKPRRNRPYFYFTSPSFNCYTLSLSLQYLPFVLQLSTHSSLSSLSSLLSVSSLSFPVDPSIHYMATHVFPGICHNTTSLSIYHPLLIGLFHDYVSKYHAIPKFPSRLVSMPYSNPTLLCAPYLLHSFSPFCIIHSLMQLCNL